MDAPAVIWHMRFSPELKDWFCGWIAAKSSRYLVAEEVGSETEKLHYHANFAVSVDESTIRKAVNKELARLGLKSVRGKENAYYSMKICTDESYAAKEGKIVETSGYTNEEISELISQGQKRFPPGRKTLTPAADAKKAKEDYLEKLISQGVEYVKSLGHDTDAINASASACRFLLKAKGGRTDVNKALPIINAIMWRLKGHSRYWMEDKFITDIQAKVLNRAVINMNTNATIEAPSFEYSTFDFDEKISHA